MVRVSNSREIPSPRGRGALNYVETRGGLGILQDSYPTHVLHKGGGKRRHNVADTLLRTQMFPLLPARATFVADTKFVSETQKCF